MDRSLDRAIDLIESFIQRIGDDWLDEHQAQPNSTPHEIALWISQYRGWSDPDTLANSQHLVLLGRLAKCIAILEGADVGPLDNLWRDLLSDNPSRVKSALHEIRVAAIFCGSGFPVKIIPEGRSRTPDLLVGDAVEIECKCKGPASDADRARHEIYSLLDRKLRKVLVAGSRCGALVVTARFHVEPERMMIDEIIESARSIIRGSGPMSIDSAGPLFDYSIEGVDRGDVEPAAALSLPRRPFGSKPFDIETNSGIVVELPDGSKALDQLIFMSLSCDVEHDYIRGVKSSLKSAAGQFSGDRPTIIVVDVTDTLGTVPDSYFDEVGKLIEEFLRSNSKVSRVDLESNWFEDGESGVVLRRGILPFENRYAKHALPTEFALVPMN
ncbi:hypothetical protein ACQP06_11915 [Nocardia sp. CA-136227]|uniref:hypothetical protein n=1 Tax=Nocardia sp. CA-136227 TaxID=3239979 RepID=UPI003D970AB6